MTTENKTPATAIREYLASLKSIPAQSLFAESAGTTLNYLKGQVIYGRKKISPEFALLLERASDGVLKAHELAPDFDWTAAASQSRCDCAKATREEM